MNVNNWHRFATLTRALTSLGSERVFPSQSREPGKVAVCRTQDQPVFDGECREVRIRYQICMHTRPGEKVTEYLAMTFGRLRNPRPLGREPRQHLPPCVPVGGWGIHWLWVKKVV